MAARFKLNTQAINALPNSAPNMQLMAIAVLISPSDCKPATNNVAAVELCKRLERQKPTPKPLNRLSNPWDKAVRSDMPKVLNMPLLTI